MSLLSSIVKFFTGDSTMSTVESIATEWIETDLEKAEAKTVMIKALDPNGAMRRQLSSDVTQMYKVYLITMLLLITIEFICAFANIDVNTDALQLATDKLIELFVPITSLFGVIVTASFGVNYANIRQQDKK